MRMEQGVRTGLGHGGITCVLQTQSSSLFYLFIFFFFFFFQNIVLSGGSTMFKDFGRKLQRDVKRQVDARLKLSEELSQGRIKVSKVLSAFRDTNIFHLRNNFSLPVNYR